MSATLYLLRQQPDRISPSLFQPGDTDMDIVFIEKAAAMVPPSIKETVAFVGSVESVGSHPTLTYGELVEKIFSADRIIVL
ncbi:MAG TPA: hypothetical protein VJ760_07570 [Nitrospiraceae bacterium]|nr:hypothetical protein [Nitrospiraceae bacterium]